MRGRAASFILVLGMLLGGCEKADESSEIDTRLLTHAILPGGTVSSEALRYAREVAKAHDKADAASHREDRKTILQQALALELPENAGEAEVLRLELAARLCETLLEDARGAPEAVRILGSMLAPEQNLPIDRATARALVVYGDAARKVGNDALAAGSYAPLASHDEPSTRGVGAVMDYRVLLCSLMLVSGFGCARSSSGQVNVPEEGTRSHEEAAEGRQEGDSPEELRLRLGKLNDSHQQLFGAATEDPSKCEDLCSLATSICGIKEKLCNIADEHVGREEYQRLCREAKQDCGAARESCIDCVEMHASCAPGEDGAAAGSESIERSAPDPQESKEKDSQEAAAKEAASDDPSF